MRVPRFWLPVAVAACLAAAASAQQSHLNPDDDARHVIMIRDDDDRPMMAWGLRAQGAYLGVQLMELTPELREHFGAPSDVGVMVAKVNEDSPAEAAGIEVGDIVTAIDGDSIASSMELARRIARQSDGEIVELEIWRDGSVESLQATLARRERPWIDIREFRAGPEGLGRLRLPELQFDQPILMNPETLNKALERLNEELSSPEWKDRVRRFHEHQSGLLERIEVLERRLRELERQLEQLPDDS